MVFITNTNNTASSSFAKITARIIKSILVFTLLLPTTSTSTVVLAFSSQFSSISSRPTNNKSSRSPFSPSSIFRPSSSQQLLLLLPKNYYKRSSSSTTTTLNLLGSDSGLLGVGAPEVAVILLVGYFILGPSDLYKLVKEIGKFIQNVRTLGAEAAKSFEGTMEDQLELKELRRAQSELNEAFGFRRSINTSEFREAFDRTGATAAAAATGGGAAATAATAGLDSSSTGSGNETATSMAETNIVGREEVEETDAPKRKRRLVRRKKKKMVDETNEIDVASSESESESEWGGYDNTNFALEYPDLETLDSVVNDDNNNINSDDGDDLLLRAQRMERLQQSSIATADTASVTSNQENEREDIMMDWFTASDEDIASKILNQSDNTNTNNIVNKSFEKQRFQSQLSAEDWNAQIMAREDELSPLSMVMQRLAILDEEKRAADKRIEEEYTRRLDNEDKYYLEKRSVLLEAIADIQEGVYGNHGNNDDDVGGGGGSDEKLVEEDKGGGEISSATNDKVGDDADNDDDNDMTASMPEKEINATNKFTP